VGGGAIIQRKVAVRKDRVSSKPRLFIASSVERLDLAYAVQEELEHTAEATVWTQGAFELSRSTMESLLDILSESDFGLFVFAPDDVTQVRGGEKRTVRDNVVFELGLFVGRLGPERSFIIAPAATEMHLPTDLLGITPATFDADRQDRNIRAALGPACNRVRRAIARQGAFQAGAMLEAGPTDGTGDDPITDEGDIRASLQGWMGSRPASSNSATIRFADVDRELGLAPGSAKRFIADIARRWSYRVAHQGEQTILFEKVRDGRPSF